MDENLGLVAIIALFFALVLYAWKRKGRRIAVMKAQHTRQVNMLNKAFAQAEARGRARARAAARAQAKQTQSTVVKVIVKK